MCRNELENPRWWVLVCYCAEVQSIPITLVDREVIAKTTRQRALIGSRCLAATTSHRATCEGTRGARELELGFVCAYVRAGGGHDMKEGVAARRGRAPHLTTITLRIGPRISRGRSRSAIGFLWTGRGWLPTCCSKISQGFRHNFY